MPYTIKYLETWLKQNEPGNTYQTSVEHHFSSEESCSQQLEGKQQTKPFSDYC